MTIDKNSRDLNIRTENLYDKFLTGSIFEKKFADNGREALAIYESWKPELVILDIMLPAMTGYLVLKEIRQRHFDTETAIIMVSSVARKESIVDCIEIGIQGYIVKPFNHKELLDKVLEYFEAASPDRARSARAVLHRS